MHDTVYAILNISENATLQYFIFGRKVLTCYIIVKEKNLISSCFRSNPNVCMIENCIVLYEMI